MAHGHLCFLLTAVHLPFRKTAPTGKRVQPSATASPFPHEAPTVCTAGLRAPMELTPESGPYRQPSRGGVARSAFPWKPPPHCSVVRACAVRAWDPSAPGPTPRLPEAPAGRVVPGDRQLWGGPSQASVSQDAPRICLPQKQPAAHVLAGADWTEVEDAQLRQGRPGFQPWNRGVDHPVCNGGLWTGGVHFPLGGPKGRAE